MWLTSWLLPIFLSFCRPLSAQSSCLSFSEINCFRAALFRCTSSLPPTKKARQPLVAQGLLSIEASDHTQTHHCRYGSSGWVISPTQRPLPDNTKHSRNRHPRPRRDSNSQSQQVNLRPRGHWDRPA